MGWNKKLGDSGEQRIPEILLFEEIYLPKFMINENI